MTEEVLVFLPGGEDPAGARARLERGAIQSAGGRLFIVAPTLLADEPGLNALRSEEDLRAVAAELSEAEQLFARAFLARRQAGEEERPGEGLPWDTPGYEAP
ncbi:hypothetical protein [Defluviimonas sp. SAOS-178_SWC]|uniref:hypothetical protein n=1 Tax=Defluviimonas sp. SAOS-178_SWC TaxID=3121287 RepID=UPI003221DD71